MSDHSAPAVSVSKGSSTGYGTLIVVFAIIIFTLLWSFNAFSPLDYSRKTKAMTCVERSEAKAGGQTQSK